jgi:ubiquinone/menaquinone biosynthesis C-methylase UbiE
MSFKRFISSQLRKPTGWFGSLVVSRVMNRVNRQIIEGTLALLELEPQHHVLEIGFGGGSALSGLSRRLPSSVISGIDISPDLVRKAESRFCREIADGRVRVQLGDISQLPFPTAAFDRVFSINTIYFWPDALLGFREIRRVLKDGGLAAVSLRSREKMQNYAVTKYNFRLFSKDEVAELMLEVGFRNVRIDHRDKSNLYDQVIVLGNR